jgi:parallel beta-helix repeat protein
MSSRVGTLIVLVLLLQAVPLVLLAPAPVVEAQDGSIIIGTDETVTWEDGTRNLTGAVEIFGTLVIRDYELRFNLTLDGEASFRVKEGGLLEFHNVSLLHDNLSAYFFFKVEGRFVAYDSEIEWLTGQFVTGGGIKIVGGEVEMYNTHLHDCEVQGIYVENEGGSVLLDNCKLEQMQYGVHLNDGGNATIRNGTSIELFSRAGVLVNHAGAHVSNSTVMSDDSSLTQGIAARGSEIIVVDTVIHDIHNEGIELADEASAVITNCEIYNCTVGIRLSSSSANIWSSNIHDNVDGLNLWQSDPNVRQTHLVDNFNGISSKDCSPGYELEDCIIGGNIQYGIYAIGKGLSHTGTTWTFQGNGNTIARIIQWWLLDVNVTDKDGIPIAGAKVIVRTSNGTRLTNKTTDALGSVRDIELEGYRIDNDGTNSTAQSYEVRIEAGERWVEKSTKMDGNKVLIVALGDEPSITDNVWVLVIPIVIVLLIVVSVIYWWRNVR